MVPLDCAVSCDCSIVGDFSVVYNFSVIGEGHAVLHGQGGVFRYGQRFARWNLYILLNGWISIDCASISLEDNAAPTVLFARIADTPIGNNQGMTVRSGCKATVRTSISAADSGCINFAGCGDITAVDGDCATRTLPSAADPGSIISADCLHCAAVDGDSAARTRISAADSGCTKSAGCGDTAAVDDNIAAATTILTAADSGCTHSAGCGQRSHVFPDRLGINGKTVALCHIDTVVDGQACAVCQNQMNLAADGDAVADGHSAVDYIPAVTPCGHAAFHHSDIICCLFIAVFVQIGNAVLRQ